MSGQEPPDGGDDGSARTGSIEQVGYGKPPRKHQFQPGQSGNPKGRPKRTPSTGDTFRKVLKLPVTIAEGGRRRKISTEEALFRGMRKSALEGDARARRDYLDAIERYAPEQLQSIRELFAEDDRLLRELRHRPSRDSHPNEHSQLNDADRA